MSGLQKMTAIEVSRCLASWEKKYDLLSHQFAGWSVWPVFRMEVGTQLNGVRVDRRTSVSNARLLPRLRQTWNDVSDALRLPPCDTVVVTYDSNLTGSHDGRAKDIFFDDVLSGVSRFCKIEHVTSSGYRDVRSNAWKQSDITTTAEKALSKLLSQVPFYPGSIRPAKAIADCLQHEGIVGYSVGTVARALRRFAWQKQVYRAFLGRVRPKRLLLLTAYCDCAVVAAAKELGVEVLELQHGLVGPDHWGYSWPEEACRYQDRMPIPDKLLLYGEFWATQLRRSGFWKDKLLVVGNPRMDGYRERAKGPPDIDLLVTTQGVEIERIAEFVREFVALSEARVVVKLHPVEVRTEVHERAFAGCENVQLLRSQDAPHLYELFLRTRFHLSVSSTCHYEALGLGVPTAILPYATHDAVLGLTETGCAEVVETPQALVSFMADWGDKAVPDAVRSTYFRDHAVENIQSLLQSP